MKQKLKIIVDVFMTAALLLLMSYNLIGDVTHEIIGAATLVIFIIHHVLNRKWIKSIFKGRYTPFRILQTLIAILVLLTMLVQMFSGITLSRHVFSFIHIDGLTSAARIMHMLGAYWGFVLMSLHLGLHWHLVISRVKIKLKKSSKAKQIMFATPSFILAAYGVYAFISRGLADYMFLKNQFVFFDFSEPLILFFIDYLEIMVLFIFVGYYFSKLIICLPARHKNKKSA